MSENELITNPDQPNEEKVAAFVFSDGNIVDVNKARLDSSKSKRDKKKQSNAIDIDEDDFGEQYASGRVYRPTLNFANMKQFSLENLYHARCIKQIALDSTSAGWDILTVDAKGQPVKNEVKWSTKDNRLYTFFQDSFGADDFDEGARSCLINFDTFGVNFVELTRRKNGEPAKFKLLPTETCRISRNLNDPAIPDSDMKYVVQVVNTHERIFKIFDGDVPNLIEPHTHNPMSEVLIIRNYSVMGGKYGIPDWVPALKSMIGNDKVADYNISFFDNEAVPRFAVIVQGGKLDDETKKDIKSYFKKDLKGVQNAHKTLVLTTPKGTEVKLVPLAFEMKDGGFRFYRKDNRDEIISAHGVPPHRLQIYDSGNGGTLSPGMLFDLDKTYKYSIINPHQKRLESIFNKVVRLTFGIKDKQLRFNELDIGEDKDRADTLKTIASAHEKYYNMGTMTPDEIRADNKQERYQDMESSKVDPETLEWAKTPKPVYLLRQAQKQQDAALQANVGGQNVNETPNDFGDKSKEQTGNTLTDKNIEQLMMKRKVDDIVEKVDMALSSLSDLTDKIEDIVEAEK
jgi:PBSX family phage portal protein